MGLRNYLECIRGNDEVEHTRPKLLNFRSAKSFIIFTVTFAVSTDIFMYGLLVPMTPTALKDKLGMPEDEIQSWTSILLALYSAAFLVSSPILGHLADRARTRRWPLLLGLVTLGVATALLCIGTNIGLWIAGRLLQGAAVAVVWTAGLALLVDTVGKQDLGQAIGYLTMGLNIGILAGPLVGGVVYQYGGYYAVFGLAFGLLGVDFVLRVILVEPKQAARWLDRGQGRGPLTPLEQPVDNTTSFSMAGTGEPTNTSGIPVPSLKRLIFIPLVVPHFLDPLTGMLIDRVPTTTRYLISGAFLCTTPPTVALRLINTNSIHDKILLCGLLALLGLSLAIAITPLTLEVFHALNEKELERPGQFGAAGAVALAFGLSNMAFAAGSLVGPFFAGYIRQRAGWETMGWAIGLVSGGSSIPAFLFSGAGHL
ncbi:major facilitator superfamily domain-containing protein [Aspergillus crustosus]